MPGQLYPSGPWSCREGGYLTNHGTLSCQSFSVTGARCSTPSDHLGTLLHAFPFSVASAVLASALSGGSPQARITSHHSRKSVEEHPQGLHWYMNFRASHSGQLNMSPSDLLALCAVEGTGILFQSFWSVHQKQSRLVSSREVVGYGLKG